jgi:uncharacterized protein YjbI with pentapeptide repeats
MSNKYAEKIKQRRESAKLKKNIEDNNQSEDKRLFSFVYWGTLFFICLLGFFLYLSFKYDSLSEWIIQIALLMLVLFLLAILIIPKIYVQSLQKYSDNSFDQRKEKLKLEDDTRKTAAQIIGGVLVIGSLIFTYNTLRLQQDTYRLQQEGQFTDRFTKAITQIGDEKLEVRLGGLFALERVAKDSPKDHPAIMEVLSAYVREKSKAQKEKYTKEQIEQKKSDETIENSFSLVSPDTDIRIAINLINRRNFSNDPADFKFDFIEANFRHTLLNNAKFTETNFSLADLLYTDFTSSNLSKCGFSFANLKFTNFSKANLTEAVFQFTKISGANFDNANLTKASFFNSEFKATNFLNTNLTNVSFKNIDIRDVRNLTYNQLSKAIINENTILPDNLEAYRDELLKTSKNNEEELNKTK